MDTLTWNDIGMLAEAAFAILRRAQEVAVVLVVDQLEGVEQIKTSAHPKRITTVGLLRSSTLEAIDLSIETPVDNVLHIILDQHLVEFAHQIERGQRTVCYATVCFGARLLAKAVLVSLNTTKQTINRYIQAER